ncbi:hypothetical protein AALO_G00027760 [Alosa alosa]|uniref:Uncharacterized protein n=1 Tax=Alosa alosa TaxID=278164 RepID=A0AAV6HF02_9TELE|nr:hypothetical protein AALO_G00027760 [Alosa alosa]
MTIRRIQVQLSISCQLAQLLSGDVTLLSGYKYPDASSLLSAFDRVASAESCFSFFKRGKINLLVKYSFPLTVSLHLSRLLEYAFRILIFGFSILGNWSGDLSSPILCSHHPHIQASHLKPLLA